MGPPDEVVDQNVHSGTAMPFLRGPRQEGYPTSEAVL